MRIVPQLVNVSHTFVPGAVDPHQRLLAAPPIAGLLPARIPAKSQARIEIVQHQAYRQETPPPVSPRVYRSFVEWRAADEELRQHFERSHPTLRSLYHSIYGESANG